MDPAVVGSTAVFAKSPVGGRLDDALGLVEVLPGREQALGRELHVGELGMGGHEEPDGGTGFDLAHQATEDGDGAGAQLRAIGRSLQGESVPARKPERVPPWKRRAPPAIGQRGAARSFLPLSPARPGRGPRERAQDAQRSSARQRRRFLKRPFLRRGGSLRVRLFLRMAFHPSSATGTAASARCAQLIGGRAGDRRAPKRPRAGPSCS